MGHKHGWNLGSRSVPVASGGRWPGNRKRWVCKSKLSRGEWGKRIQTPRCPRKGKLKTGPLSNRTTPCDHRPTTTEVIIEPRCS